ncbi:MAG: sugar phosphate isomerase/epimerase [Planctomycetales bacterium]|nr:sugar phosphate isomerase/epimerase [Planctomycetales bacterium]
MSTLSMNQVTTYRWNLDEEVQRYREAGYEGIGVWRQKLADFGESRGIDLIAESGLRVTHLAWAGGFTGSDGRTFNESMHDAIEAVQTAAALQAGCLVVYPGGRNNHTYRHAERLLHAALDELLDYATAADVVLALEPVHQACAAEWSFQTEAGEAVAFIERFASPHLKLALDAYHFGDCPEVLANLGELAPHTALVHVADRREPRSIDQSRCALGAGAIPLAEFVTGLIDAGYAGDFDVKIYGPDATPADYESLLASSLAASDAWSPVRGG